MKPKLCNGRTRSSLLLGKKINRYNHWDFNMKLTDFNKKDHAAKAIKENYGISFNVTKMDINDTKVMLKKVRSLATEAKQTPDFYKTRTTDSYMKLVFMEQALVTHYNKLASSPKPRIVFENEEVEKSQVVLAAQDLVDSVQKMLEQVSDMTVKELPALVDSIQSEIGANESEQFNTQVAESLSTLTTTLTQCKSSLQSALNVITGQGGTDAFNPADTDVDAEAGEMPDMDVDAEAGEMPDMDMEEPEFPPVSGAGRARR